ncbi:hypothetical protein [Paenibacillus sp. FSL P4-0184]|uniref:hypothetical protein n=1 Tax=Paenibacillus sp. FSL P4-0184 TaxID=2921632 RepID=UPI0030F5CEEE
MAKNKVIAGDYEGKVIMSTLGIINLQTGFLKTITIDKNTVEDYELMDETHSKSAVSAVGRGLVGGFLLGPVGCSLAFQLRAKEFILLQFSSRMERRV